ncbi:MAG: response regulator [Nitrospiraceae bacterium]|nr:MAG: response regulator [Nitrospiraceae bacterium]
MYKADKFKIFVADSTPSVRQFIRFNLEDYFGSIEMDMASNGKNVKSRLLESHHDLIIYEREMPLMDGDEFLQWIKSQEAFVSVPVIIISSNRETDSLKKTIQLGADSCIIKPFTAESLVEKVSELLNGKGRKKFDRRKHLRYSIKGRVELRCERGTYEGALMNICLGGLLIRFDGNSPLPQILDTIRAAAIPENKAPVEEIEGYVTRIQAVDAMGGSKQVHIAVKFSDDREREKKQELLDILTASEH